MTDGPEEPTATTDEATADSAPEGVKATRERSTIQFPYNDLGDAIAIATKVWNPYAGECDIGQLAGAMGQKPSSGAFRTKVLAAKMFGLVQGSQQLVLTPLGRDIVNAYKSKSAKADAFLKVPLFKAMFDEVASAGGMLPAPDGVRTLIARFGVVQNQVETAYQSFVRSARQAGYFEMGTDRLVRPAVVPLGAALEPEPEPEPQDDHSHDANRVQNGTVEAHPLMVGLLQSLPALGAPFPNRDRERWLNAVKVNFDFMYGPADEEPSKPAAVPDISVGLATAVDDLARDDAAAS